LVKLSWYASDGAGWIPAASIQAGVDTTPGVNDMPGNLRFFTTADGAASATERMRIDSVGRVGIGLAGGAALAQLHVAAPNTTAPSLTYGTVSGQILRNENSELAIGLSSTSPYPLYMQGRTSASAARDLVLQPLGGNVGIGVTPATLFHTESDTASNDTRLAINNTSANPATIRFTKRRGTAASKTVVANADQLGAIYFSGYDGAADQFGAAIIGGVDATPGAGDMPGRLLFYTTADGGTSLTERMRIDNAGLITGTGTSLGAWTAYTPTLGGTGWAIGDGTAYGHYCRVGKIVHFRVLITLGATSTAGAGVATITGPVTSANTVTYSEFQTSYYDASGTTIYTGAARMDANSTTIRLRAISSSVGALTAVFTTTSVHMGLPQTASSSAAPTRRHSHEQPDGGSSE
jgi:hypothetical protein